MASLEDLVAPTHFYRRLDHVLNLSFVRELPDATLMLTKQGTDMGYHTHYVVDGGKARIILQGKELRFDRPHSTEQSRRYRARAKDCNHCPLKAQCTTSKQRRSLCRSVDEEYLDRVRAYQPTEVYKKALRKRSVWVEPLFAEGKDWHSMRRLRLRELERVNCEALVRAAGQNLKSLLKKRGGRHRPGPAQTLFASFLAALGCFART